MDLALPSQLRSSLGGTTATRLDGRTEVWRVEMGGGDVVLRRNDPASHPPSESTVTNDIGWVHRFLSSRDGGGLGLPRPVPLFDGASVVIADGAVWEALTFVPGRVVGWDLSPTMYEVGRLLARFHEVVAETGALGQRQPCIPVDTLTDQQWSRVELSSTDRRTVMGSLASLTEDLEDVDHAGSRRTVIHGDITNHNILATGLPPKASGVIDFANAYCEATLADIGFALWRSGRPSQSAESFDHERIASFLAGYHSRRPLDQTDVRAVTAYLRARGLQIMAKRARRTAVVDTGPIRKLDWLAHNLTRLNQRLSSAVRLLPTNGVATHSRTTHCPSPRTQQVTD